MERRVQRGVMLEMVSEEVELPGGRRVALDLIHHPGASAVVPFVSDDEILLIRQYRHAAGGEIYEVPAGKLDPGETPLDCAARELEEETGYRAARLDPLGEILTTPGFTDERIHLFSAHGLSPGRQKLGDDELIELVPLHFARALEMLWAGEIPDAKSGLALVHAARRRDRGE